MATYYVTTSIPYVNGTPHLGHALEFVQADVLARYHRLRGDDTRFQTGTDDNALKNVRAAARDLDAVLANLAEALRLLGQHLAPFLPDASARILAQLGDEGAGRHTDPDAAAWDDTLAGRQIQPAGPLLPRIELTAGE